MISDRPDPDELLARVSEESRKQERGRLKIFFGAAPGVGKTYAMLCAARRQLDAGVDVVVGIVETHGRQETEALLEGLPVLPARTVQHRSIEIEEFDLDAALVRKPTLLLVDELAHSNAPGSRHVKRWQDVFELVDAGIHIYATLNVQHLDSLNDLVAQITGVTVRETVPDSVLDQADEIELVDLPVDELRRRMEEGKVYIPDRALYAMENFFRPGNLIALRELALRRTADRVDAQMRSYRRDHSIQSTWPVAERLMVSIGPSPFSAKLIRTAKRLADRLDAEWIVAFVETPKHATASLEVRRRVSSALRLAHQLGAETVTLTGDSVVPSLLQYARSRNVSRIVVGKNAGPLWRRLWRGSLLDTLLSESGDIQVIAVAGEVEALPTGSRTALKGMKQGWKEYAHAVLVVSVCTLLSITLRGVLNPVNLVMFYLLGVVLVGMRSRRRVAIAASILSVAAFDVFCVPPYLNFAVTDYEYLVTFAVMLTVGIIVSTLTVRIRMQAARAADREARAQALYRLTKELAGKTKWFDAAQTAASITREEFRVKLALFFPDEQRKIQFESRTAEGLPVPLSEVGVAQWVFDHGQNAGYGTDTLPGSTALYLPLKGSQHTLGVMAVAAGNEDLFEHPEQLRTLELFASQAALAIERAQATAAARDAQLKAETEQMRSGLLSAVSHDLRTPLATITGAASSLLSQRQQMSQHTQSELLESIVQEAERLSRLVGNLLEMTRLESGAVVVKREWHPLEEIVGAALTRLDHSLEGRSIKTDIPDDLPLVSVDDVLLEQVFLNVLENAVKYTPTGSPLGISARAHNQGVAIEFTDSGAGFEAGDETRIWEKFYRGSGGTERTRGAGLGLAICRAIVAAHGGTIEAENRVEGGALIRIWLPSGGTPPEALIDA